MQVQLQYEHHQYIEKKQLKIQMHSYIETIDTNINFVDLLISVMAPIRGAVNNRVKFEITNVQLKYSADDAGSNVDAQY